MGRMWAVLALAATLTGCGVIDTKDADTPTTPPPQPTAEVGQPVRDGQFEFVVTEVGGLPQPWYGPAPPGRGEWVVVTMTVTNAGDRPQTFLAANQKLIDSQGRQYGADPGVAGTLSGTTDGTNAWLNPGFDIKVKVPFDVTAGAQAAAVEVHDSTLSGGARINVA